MSGVARDTGLKSVSTVIAGLVNGLIFTGMAMAGLSQGEPPPPDLPAIDVEVVTMIPKLGTKPPEPKKLPRITELAPPPTPKDEEISLSREKEEEELERERERKKELERIEAERKKREDEERQRKLDEKRRRQEDERRRKKAMQDALDRIPDPRADIDEDAPGFEEGSAAGRSLDPNSIRNKQLYIAQLMVALQRQFEVPSVIPDDVRKRLQATVSFKVNAQGKVVGEPRLMRSSGNKFFDQAALNTVRKFGPGSALRIPLPTDEKLRKQVLRQGLQPKMHGKDM